MSYQIFLPSHMRVNKQFTLQNMTAQMRSNTTLVVQDEQAWDYEEVADRFQVKEMVVLPPTIISLSPTYEHIIHTLASCEKFFILDDDLRFAYKEFFDIGDKSLVKCDADLVLNRMMQLLDDKLDTEACVGVSARAGNNNIDPDKQWVYNSRMMRFTGYQTDIVQQVHSNRVKCRDDFDRHLQLMRMGYRTATLAEFAQDQCGGSNSDGGCSTYRDSDMLAKEAHRLKELHPDFVKVVTKNTKASWGTGGTRTDVVIQWKKAYESSQI